jgi:hypothetical protein
MFAGMLTEGRVGASKGGGTVGSRTRMEFKGIPQEMLHRGMTPSMARSLHPAPAKETGAAAGMRPAANAQV